MIVREVGKWVTIIVSIAGILWKVTSYLDTQAINSRLPFLDLQLSLYEEAVKKVEILATSSDPDELKAAEERFWQLYWGELGMVENGGIKADEGGVEAAMVQFGNQLRSNPNDRQRLHILSLEVAHACRNSLAASWGVTDWRAPIYVAPAKGSPRP